MYGFRVLRGLWGFCARVELGGFGACGVFAFRFLLFSSCPLFFSFRPALVLLPCLASALGLVLSLFVAVVVSFSLTVYGQKERARRVWCVLSCPVVGLLWVYYMFSAFLSVDSFAFENIHPAPQVR